MQGKSHVSYLVAQGNGFVGGLVKITSSHLGPLATQGNCTVRLSGRLGNWDVTAG